jgi:enamine deaminase RidA (YjgF/YER057c/UK114 family)
LRHPVNRDRMAPTKGEIVMRAIAVLLLCALAAPASAQIARKGAADAPIATSVSIPARARTVHVSGTVPDPQPDGTWGDTAAQTRSVLRKIEAALKAEGLGLGDVVKMQVFLVAPPGQARMDFAGMMTGYREFFGTPAQPNKPARSTMQVAGLVNPDWLVEIEVTAAR